MKTALLFFSRAATEKINTHAYLSACIEMATQDDDCVLLTPCDYSVYKYLSTESYLNSIHSAIHVIYLFTDFGTDELMNKIISQYAEDGSTVELRYRRLPEENIRSCSDDVKNILNEVAARSGIPIEFLVSKTRQGEVVKYRQFYCLRAHTKTKCSLSKIGEVIGKDHATVLHAIRRVSETRLDAGRTLLDEYNEFFECVKVVNPKAEPKPNPEEVTQPRKINGKQVAFTGPYMGYKVHSR